MTLVPAIITLLV